MKLYRGIKAKEFSHFTPEVSRQLRDTWQSVLTKRAKGDLKYPDSLNEEILKAFKLTRLQRQHFTDNKEIAAGYAEANGGLVIEIELPVREILDHFTIEFQKFAQRKASFEVVYVVDAAKLVANEKKWKLTSINWVP